MADKKPLSIPIPIIDNLLQLIRTILNQMMYKDPKIISSSIRYLLLYYDHEQSKERVYLPAFIASFHLASKVNENTILLSKIINEIDILRRTIPCPQYLISVGGNLLRSVNFITELKQLAVTAEMDIITALNFSFTLPAPHKLAYSYMSRIVSWHFHQHSPIARTFKVDLYNKMCFMLNDVLLCAEFYSISAELTALVLVQLAFDYFQIPILKIGGRFWSTILEPLISVSDFDKIYKQFQDFFYHHWDSTGFSRHGDPLIDRSLFNQFLIYPIEADSMGEEPNCPPPPLDFFKEWAGPPDIYNNWYPSHAPLAPPPETDDKGEYEGSNSIPQFSIAKCNLPELPSTIITQLTQPSPPTPVSQPVTPPYAPMGVQIFPPLIQFKGGQPRFPSYQSQMAGFAPQFPMQQVQAESNMGMIMPNSFNPQVQAQMQTMQVMQNIPLMQNKQQPNIQTLHNLQNPAMQQAMQGIAGIPQQTLFNIQKMQVLQGLQNMQAMQGTIPLAMQQPVMQGMQTNQPPVPSAPVLQTEITGWVPVQAPIGSSVAQALQFQQMNAAFGVQQMIGMQAGPTQQMMTDASREYSRQMQAQFPKKL